MVSLKENPETSMRRPACSVDKRSVFTVSYLVKLANALWRARLPSSARLGSAHAQTTKINMLPLLEQCRSPQTFSRPPPSSTPPRRRPPPPPAGAGHRHRHRHRDRC